MLSRTQEFPRNSPFPQLVCVCVFTLQPWFLYCTLMSLLSPVPTLPLVPTMALALFPKRYFSVISISYLACLLNLSVDYSVLSRVAPPTVGLSQC